jgi:hypothetical protein
MPFLGAVSNCSGSAPNGRQIGQRVREGFALEDIVVLTLRGLESSSLSTLPKFGGYAVSRFDRFDDRGNARFTPGQVRFESVYRFKGQQAQAVILGDIDYDSTALGPIGSKWRSACSSAG